MVAVGGFEQASGTYTLVLETFAPETRKRGSISPGQKVSGTLEPGERERWMIEARAGQTLELRTTGFVTVLEVYGPDGELVADIDDNERKPRGLSSLIEVVAPVSGAYVVEVSGFHGRFGFATGTYRLSFRLGPAATPAASQESARATKQTLVLDPQAAVLDRVQTAEFSDSHGFVVHDPKL